MAREKQVARSLTIEFRDPPPAQGYQGGRWLQVLTPLLKHRGKWAMIKECDSPEQAGNHQQNLNQRKVRIPEPEHDWAFAARGCELFAIYHGPKRPARTRRKGK